MNSESILQQTTVAMIRALYPSLVLNLSLNGISLNGLPIEQRSKLITQAKREGLEPGIQDLSIYLPNGQILNLEFKRPKGGVQSDEQKAIQTKLNALGHNYYLVRSFEEVFKLIAENTLKEFRNSQFYNLAIPSDTEVLTSQFLHWSKGTELSIVINRLKELYGIS